MSCGWRLTAVVALLICLRAAERYTRVRQHGIVSRRAAAPHSLLNPQRGPKFAPRALTAAELAKLPPHARPLPLDEARALWRPEIGGWLASYAPQHRRARHTHTTLRGCGAGCGGEGTCDEERGVCQCTSGWRGARCEERERWSCNAADGRYLWSRCAGACDERYGYCLCGSRGAHPERPLLQCEPIGIEAQVRPWQLDRRNAAERHNWTSIWSGGRGAPGWCDADAPAQPAAKCACRYDGLDGYLCQHRTAQFCLNQCSGRGRCRQGHCTCDPGWWGVDCSLATLPPPAPPPPESTALRPRVYVYEMPAEFTTALLQRRHDKLFCVPRTYLKDNRTQYAYGIYQGYVLEVLLHEWLLASPHRTRDPAEADWFYVPVYASCAIVTAIFETPNSTRTRHRLALASRLYARALAHVRSAHPYWDASGGVDHVWTFGYDEGACFAPRELWPSMLISHWGNTMAKHNRCTTTYDPDRWDVARDPTSRLPLALAAGDHPCYDPRKDVVMPSFRDLDTFLPPRAGEPPPDAPRPSLFFFAGDLGSPAGSTNAGPHTHRNYSLGIRQAVYRALRAENDPRLEIVGHLARDWWHIEYHKRMRAATFCGAFPGDGWSGGISSAIFAGCVPLIISDGIELPFENVLDYSLFSLRVAEADIPRLPALLRAIPPRRIAELQRGVRAVRSRFGYASIAPNELRISPNRTLAAPLLAPLAAAAGEDALHTLLRVMLFRAATRDHPVRST